jgi:signal transduction protein with GAF and PtsI domain
LPRPDPATAALASYADICLGYLAENPEELLAFMQHAGLDPAALRGAVGTSALQRGLVDYVASNEPILLALCANANIAPEAFMRVFHEINRTEY